MDDKIKITIESPDNGKLIMEIDYDCDVDDHINHFKTYLKFLTFSETIIKKIKYDGKRI